MRRLTAPLLLSALLAIASSSVDGEEAEVRALKTPDSKSQDFLPPTKNVITHHTHDGGALFFVALLLAFFLPIPLRADCPYR